ncbi:MAG TPA: CCA tRNA nucleotidyltransferase [Actinomycetota bacterium]|nr:CCA tRNA nucleotidyltransferase [Actinomycetota bacterium]
MAVLDRQRAAGAALDVPPLAVELGERFRAAGHQLYLVGGTVRDLILGRPLGDLDFATDARPEETLRVLRGWAERRYLQGIRFGTVGALVRGVRVEITTFRKEVYPGDDRHPFVTFAEDVEVDLSRRDFTVNAMAVRLPDREFVDPFGGLRDLAGRRLDTPLSPEESFGDDPLRMLRAARFVASLDLHPAPRVVAGMRRMAERIRIVSAERIRDELSRLLLVPRPTRGLELVVDTGLAEHFLPELPALRLEQDPAHRHKDILRHTLIVVERCEPDLVLRLAALLHDIGKPATKEVTPEGVRFHHHEVVGARMAERRLRALRYPNEVVAQVAKLVEMHLRFHTYGMGWTDAAVRRYVREAGPLLDRLNQLTRADCTTQNPLRARQLAALQDELELRIARLTEEENLEQLKPPLDGNEIMAHLGIPPGPLVGEARQYLLEQRIERGPIPKEEAYVLLERWARDRGLALPEAGRGDPPEGEGRR